MVWKIWLLPTILFFKKFFEIHVSIYYTFNETTAARKPCNDLLLMVISFCFVGVMNLVVTATGDHDIKEKITAVSTTVSQEGVQVLNRFISKVQKSRF